MLSRLVQITREDSLQEAVIRSIQYFRCKIVSRRRMKEWVHLPAQTELIADVLKGSFTLIILDACRYDYFRRIYQDFLKGDLRKVKSPASNTLAWLKVTFSENAKQLQDVRIFSANPFLNSRDIPFDGFRARDYVRERITDLWDWGWDSQLDSVPPDTVLKAVVEEGLMERNIIWFIQPHIPYIGKTRLLFPGEFLAKTKLQFPSEVFDAGRTATANRYLAIEIQNERISREMLLAAYEDNLVLVLNSVERLFDNIKPPGRVIITSDHGELLGEHGVYAHPSHINLPEQRIVPWLEVHGS